ncbi:MAG TPA: hypothetical protein VKV15_01385 [Bryobacteraceae bacterium]|nr:hypothetical protein [Bryobacteraceae bacterium]
MPSKRKRDQDLGLVRLGAEARVTILNIVRQRARVTELGRNSQSAAPPGSMPTVKTSPAMFFRYTSSTICFETYSSGGPGKTYFL